MNKVFLAVKGRTKIINLLSVVQILLGLLTLLTSATIGLPPADHREKFDLNNFPPNFQSLKQVRDLNRQLIFFNAIEGHSTSHLEFMSLPVKRTRRTTGRYLRHRVARGIPPEPNDPFHDKEARTTRAVVTIKGRDPNRQLTTYNAIDRDLTSPFEFGFPPSSRRLHPIERMEIFDSTTLSDNIDNNRIRKVTIRHLWHGVYMTSDKHHHLRACVYRRPGTSLQGRNFVCQEPPYLYLELWNTEQNERNAAGTARDNSAPTCYKMRFHFTRSRNSGNVNKRQKVGYACVADTNWEIKLRSQVTLLTHALSHATMRAWEKSLQALFEVQISNFKSRRKRNSRHRRCVVDPVELRNNLINTLTIETLKPKLKNSLKTNRACVNTTLRHRNQTFKNNYKLATHVPWKTMTHDAKLSLTCHVRYVILQNLRNALLGLANTRCLRSSKWGRLSERQRRILLDRHLTVTWLRQQTKRGDWLIEIIDDFLDSKTSSFCLNENH